LFFSKKSQDDDDELIEEEEEESGDHSILVPLEFSGGETRVLTDPDEIKEIQSHEMERYYQRKYVRKIDVKHLNKPPRFHAKHCLDKIMGRGSIGLQKNTSDEYT
jgi:hypothetical protein